MALFLPPRHSRDFVTKPPGCHRIPYYLGSAPVKCYRQATTNCSTYDKQAEKVIHIES